MKWLPLWQKRVVLLFQIGYNRAARIVDQLQAHGIVSAPGHNANREVLAPPPVQHHD